MQFRWIPVIVLASAAAVWASAPSYPVPHRGIELTTAHHNLDPVTGIVLEGGAGQSVTFSGQGASGSGINVNLGSCAAGSCSMSGTFGGSGGLAATGTFTLTSAENAIVLNPTGSAGLYSVSSSSPIAFTLSGTANGSTGTLLSGKLNLVNFYQPPLPGGLGWVIGGFNVPVAGGVAPDATITGGLLANAFTSAGGILQLNVQMASPALISNLIGTGASLSSVPISSSLTPTPEPATLFLLLAGILGLGAAGWRSRLHGNAWLPAR